jgi:tripartite-type tricarboxylate transporter receptor subunit TctC
MRSLSIVAATMLVAAASGPIGVADAADVFSGKQLRVIVPSPPGGGYDLYGQLAVRHLGRFIPGNPGIVISYMPGAAGLNAMNYLYEVAPRDGTAIAVMAQDIAYHQAIGLKGVRYDARRFGYIGRVTTNVPVHMVWHSAAITSIDEIKTREVVTGAVGTGGHVDLPRAQNKLIGTRWMIISGYKGGNELRIAMERGELQAGIAPATLFRQQLKPWLDDGKVKIVAQYADFRHPTLPQVPTLVELGATPDAKGVFKLLVSVATVGRGYGVPPSVPAATLDILRKAFGAMTKDSDFKADAEKRGADLMPMSGEAFAAYVESIVATPPDITRKTSEAIAGK